VDKINTTSTRFRAAVDPADANSFVATLALTGAVSAGTNGTATISVANGTAIAKLAGTATQGATWTLTLDGTPFAYTAASGDDLAAIARGLVGRGNSNSTRYKANVDPSDATSFVVSVVDPFYADFRVTPATDGTATVPIKGGTVTASLGGDPAQGEVWTLTLDGTTFAYTVEFRDDLATIARKLGNLLKAPAYVQTY